MIKQIFKNKNSFSFHMGDKRRRSSLSGVFPGKRGLSDVIATILITAISILAVGIVSLYVFNIIRDNTVSLSDLDLHLNNVEAYYNNNQIISNILNANEFEETVYVSVERGRGESNLTGLKFIFVVEGNSYDCTRRNVPNLLETNVYAFKSSIFSKKPEKISVIPIVLIGKSERIARTGFEAKIMDTEMKFGERFDECGGFCCGANLDLPNNPPEPAK